MPVCSIDPFPGKWSGYDLFDCADVEEQRNTRFVDRQARCELTHRPVRDLLDVGPFDPQPWCPHQHSAESLSARTLIALFMGSSMTLNSDRVVSPDLSDTDEAEKTMRRALGLDRSAPAPRRADAQPSGDRFHHQPKRQFVRDGEVPVVVLHRGDSDRGGKGLGGSSSRAEIAETALRGEREARQEAERSLAEAQSQIRELQTRLGHIGLSADEARHAMLRAESEKQAALAQLEAEQAAHQVTADQLRQARAACVAMEERLRALQVAQRHVAASATVVTEAVAPSRAR
eukprot:gene2733-2772_t